MTSQGTSLQQVRSAAGALGPCVRTAQASVKRPHLLTSRTLQPHLTAGWSVQGDTHDTGLTDCLKGRRVLQQLAMFTGVPEALTA
jgi:hypothetical protein